MDRESAKKIIQQSYDASRDLSDIFGSLSEDDLEFKLAVSGMVHDIYTNIIERVFEEFPEIKPEIENNISVYGSVFGRK